MKDWDWNRLIPALDYHELVLSNWPGWDKPDGKEPAFVRFECTKGEGRQSREIAFEFDDLSQGRFYYRDFTDDAMPFVNVGETYRSMFVFQYASDCEKFKSHFNQIIFIKFQPLKTPGIVPGDEKGLLPLAALAILPE